MRVYVVTVSERWSEPIRGLLANPMHRIGRINIQVTAQSRQPPRVPPPMTPPSTQIWNSVSEVQIVLACGIFWRVI